MTVYFRPNSKLELVDRETICPSRKTLHGAMPPKNTVHKNMGTDGQAEHSTLLGKDKRGGPTRRLCFALGETDVSITRLDIPFQFCAARLMI